MKNRMFKITALASALAALLQVTSLPSFAKDENGTEGHGGISVRLQNGRTIPIAAYVEEQYLPSVTPIPGATDPHEVVSSISGEPSICALNDSNKLANAKTWRTHLNKVNETLWKLSPAYAYLLADAVKSTRFIFVNLRPGESLVFTDDDGYAIKELEGKKFNDAFRQGDRVYEVRTYWDDFFDPLKPAGMEYNYMLIRALHESLLTHYKADKKSGLDIGLIELMRVAGYYPQRGDNPDALTKQNIDARLKFHFLANRGVSITRSLEEWFEPSNQNGFEAVKIGVDFHGSPTISANYSSRALSSKTLARDLYESSFSSEEKALRQAYWDQIAFYESDANLQLKDLENIDNNYHYRPFEDPALLVKLLKQRDRSTQELSLLEESCKETDHYPGYCLKKIGELTSLLAALNGYIEIAHRAKPVQLEQIQTQVQAEQSVLLRLFSEKNPSFQLKLFSKNQFRHQEISELLPKFKDRFLNQEKNVVIPPGPWKGTRYTDYDLRAPMATAVSSTVSKQAPKICK